MQGDHPENYVALGTAVGMALTKIFSWLFRSKLSDAAQIRKELHEEVRRLSGDFMKLTRELDHWKERYWQLHKENMDLRIDLKSLKMELERLTVKQAQAEQSPPRAP